MKVLGNLFFEVESIKPIMMTEMVESGLIENLVQHTMISSDSFCFNSDENYIGKGFNWTSFNEKYCLIFGLLINLCNVEPMFKNEILNCDFLDSIVVTLSLEQITLNEEFMLSAFKLLKIILPYVKIQHLLLIYQLNLEIYPILINTKRVDLQYEILSCLNLIFQCDESSCQVKYLDYVLDLLNHKIILKTDRKIENNYAIV